MKHDVQKKMNKTKVKHRNSKDNRNRLPVAGIAGIILIVIIAGAAVIWNMYDSRVYRKCVFEAGVEIDAADFLKDTTKEIRFMEDSCDIDTTVPGDYKVRLQSDWFRYTCTATVQDTIAPAAQAVEVFFEEGSQVMPEQFVTEVDDVTDVTVAFVTQPDYAVKGRQQIDVSVTDAGGNRIVVSSYLISRITVKEMTLEAGSEFPGLSEFLLFPTEEAAFAPGMEAVDTARTGDYDIQILANDITYTTKLHIQDTVAPVVEVQDITVYNTDIVTCENFVTKAEDATKITYQFEEAPNLSKTGEQTVVFTATDEGGNAVRLSANMNVLQDTEPPVITGAGDLTVFLNDSVNFADGVSVTDNHDRDIELRVDSGLVNMSTQGVYPVTYYAKDAGGNEASVSIQVKVVADTEPPVISGAKDITVYLGQMISYKAGVTVTDNHDSEVTLEIDSSKVDREAYGEYPVTYSAVDSAGNRTKVDIIVRIIERVYTEAEAYQLASQVLAQITTPEMSQYDKLWAIYRWTRGSIGYIGSSDKSSWVKAAIEGFTDRKGDCYTYACVAKALLISAGIENRDIEKIPARTRHYWNLVNIGEGWHHFDTTPRKGQTIDFCYIKDAELMAYSNANNLSHNYDRSVYTDIQ